MVAPVDPGYPGLGRGPIEGRWEPRAWRRPVFTAVALILASVGVAWFVTATYFDDYEVHGDDMAPTLTPGDRVFARAGHDAGHGDIVIYHSDLAGGPAIGRVIATGGDLIGTFEGTVVLNSIRLDETYLPPGTVTNNLFERTIPNQYVFIMGDNRAAAADSRVFGAIRRDQLIATVALRFWPLTDLGSP